MTSKKPDKDMLKRCLNVFWVRPETAVWRACDATLLSDINFKEPSLDMGCGDGVFSFIFRGGKFGLDFDVYKAAKTDTKDFFKKKDIYDTYRKGVLKPTIIRKPKGRFTVGFDLKQNLLKKAGELGLYRRLVQGSGDDLPFNDEEFMTIFSNVVYWIPDLDKTLSELHRVLKKDGIIVITVPNDKFKKYLKSYHKYKEHQKKGNKRRSELFYKLDRGRHNTYFNCLDLKQWKKHFDKAELEIVRHENYLSRKLIRFWDIGFRPISPQFIRFSNFLEKIHLKKPVKWLYINIMCLFMSRYYKLKTKDDAKYPPAFFMFVLKKK